MSVVLLGSTSGSITLQEPAVAGTNTVNFGANTGVAILDANTPAFRNRIINGAMVIDQRNAGASTTLSTAAYKLDRWVGRADTGSGNTIQQSTTAPAGFSRSTLITIGTGASPTTSQRNYFQQVIEGYNFSDMAFGTASASPITISFRVRSSLTGTFGGAIQNQNSDRSYPFTYTIGAANTWETKSVTIAGDTTGTWTEVTNGGALYVNFDLGSGATFQGTAGAWAAADYRAASGCVQLVATSGATFYITGVQLEKGSTATSFDYRSYGTELALCQRYCPVITAPVNGIFGNGFMYASTGSISNVKLPVTARVPPTGVTVSSASHFKLYWSGSDLTCTTISFSSGTTDYAAFNFEVASGATTNAGNMLRSGNASAQLTLTGCEL